MAFQANCPHRNPLGPFCFLCSLLDIAELDVMDEDAKDIEVYLPVCVPLDGSPPYVDWEGSPWMDADNVWSNEAEEWAKNRDWEEVAERLLQGRLDSAELMRHREGK